MHYFFWIVSSCGIIGMISYDAYEFNTVEKRIGALGYLAHKLDERSEQRLAALHYLSGIPMRRPPPSELLSTSITSGLANEETTASKQQPPPLDISFVPSEYLQGIKHAHQSIDARLQALSADVGNSARTPDTTTISDNIRGSIPPVADPQQLEATIDDLIASIDHLQHLYLQLSGIIVTDLSAQVHRLTFVNASWLLLSISAFFLAIYVQQRQRIQLAQEKNSELEQEQLNLKAFQRVLGSMYEDLEMEKERALKGMKANAQLAAIVKESRDAIMGLTPEAQVSSANQAACKLFGWVRPPLGQSIFHLAGMGLREQVSVFVRRALKGQSTHLDEVLWQRNDSETLVITMSFSPIMDETGRINGVSLIARNITDQVNENKRFRLAVEASPNAMIMTNAEGDIVLLNSKAEQIFGYRERELLGQSVDLLLPPPLRMRHQAHRNRFMLSPTTRPMGANRDLFALHRNGHHIPVEIGLTHLERDGSTYVISSIVDISERLQAQRALSRLNQQLLQRNKESEQFVYTVSHDLKAPLVTISGFAKRLAASLRGQLTPKQQHQFDRISANLKTMEELLEDLLQLSRVISRSLECALIDTEATVERAVEALAGSLQNTGGEVRILRPLPPVYAQERLLFQCLQNLISNAINYRKPDTPPSITISGGQTEDYVELAVEDNGIGVDAQYHQKIFGLFERLQSAASGGTGVGLSIVKSAMEKHGGQVTVRSEVGMGSVFTLRFPRPKTQENFPADNCRTTFNE